MIKAAIISVVCALFTASTMAESIKLEVSPLKYMKYGLNKSFVGQKPTQLPAINANCLY